MKDLFKRLFRQKKKEQTQEHPLRIEGTHTTLTAESDDAELAAEALLDNLSGQSNQNVPSNQSNRNTQDVTYYNQLAERIRQAHDAATLRTMRFVAFCEQELQKSNLPKEGPGSLGLLEAELYKRIDTVDREGGELKRRWQHCLAEVTVRLMEEEAHPSTSLKEGESIKNKAATESRLTEKE